MSDAPLLSATGLSRDFVLPRRSIFTRGEIRHAVVDANLEVGGGASLGLIGESGSGKTTLVKMLLGLDRPSSGAVAFEGRPVTPGRASATRWFRRQTGVVFQDPYSSLDPRMRVLDIVAEPLRALDVTVRAQILTLLASLRDELGLTLVIVSHDLGLVNHLTARVAVMEAGRIVEQGATTAVLRSPAHDYTRRLIASVPTLPA